jgi:hypothetical protein
MAEPARDFFLRATRCNALEEAHWVHAAMASIYVGDVDGALDIAERGLSVANVTEIDARPAGPLLLMVGIYFCLCGAPFDLDVAPTLAARLEEAGLAWPPSAPMQWPLKGW